jgi:hypothetical protein
MYPLGPKKNWQKLRLGKPAIYSNVTFQNIRITNTSCRCLVSTKNQANIKPGGMSVHPRNKTKHTGYSIIKQDGGHNARASLPAWWSRPLVTAPVMLQQLTIYSSHFCIDGRSTGPHQPAGYNKKRKSWTTYSVLRQPPLPQTRHSLSTYSGSDTARLQETRQTATFAVFAGEQNGHLHIRKIKQDRQCTYNVTMGRVRVTTIAVQKQQVLHILSVCLWP